MIKLIYRKIQRAMFSVLISFAIGNTAYANDCRYSHSLNHLVANSDAISFIKITDVDLLINRNRLDPLVAITSLENYKQPLFRGFAKNKRSRIFSKYLDWTSLRRYSQYVVFMDFLDGAWVPKECGLLPVTMDNKVIGACELISDLFNEKRFKREQLCDLVHPNYVSLNILKSEISKKVFTDISFQGKARIAKLEPYNGLNRYYRIYVEFSGKDRARFFGAKKITDFSPIKVLFKVDNKEDEKSYLRLIKGSSITVNGFWTMGNFVLNTLK